MASQQREQYGSQPSASEIIEDATYSEYTPECCDQSQFISFVSPESPDGVNQITNNITGEPLGELQLGGSDLFKRRQSSKSDVVGECQRDSERIKGLEGGTSQPTISRKRIRASAPEDSAKGKKIKIHLKDDKTDEGQNGFAHLNEFLSQIQHLNDGNLNFELDVSYEHFKLKVDYSFE